MSKTEEQALNDLIKQLGAKAMPDFGKLLHPPIPNQVIHDRVSDMNAYRVQMEIYKARMGAAAANVQASMIPLDPPRLTTMPAVVLGDFVQLRNEMLINGIWLSPLSAVDGELEMAPRAHTRVQLTSNGRLRSLDHPALVATRVGRTDMIGCYHEDGPGGTCVLRCPMPEFIMTPGASYSLHLDIGFER